MQFQGIRRTSLIQKLHKDSELHIKEFYKELYKELQKELHKELYNN
jgi:hypothetical protein